MGTNFYWNIPAISESQAITLPTGEIFTPKCDLMDPVIHIGKRSAAGFYCWDCNIPLCKGGIAGVHKSTSPPLEACPNCGKKPNEKGIPLTAAVELGFKKPAITKPTGIASASSFTWAQNPYKVKSICNQNNSKVICSEYAEQLTGVEFLEMLENNCPIIFSAVGEWFS